MSIPKESNLPNQLASRQSKLGWGIEMDTGSSKPRSQGVWREKKKRMRTSLCTVGRR